MVWRLIKKQIDISIYISFYSWSYLVRYVFTGCFIPVWKNFILRRKLGWKLTYYCSTWNKKLVHLYYGIKKFVRKVMFSHLYWYRNLSKLILRFWLFFHWKSFATILIHVFFQNLKVFPHWLLIYKVFQKIRCYCFVKIIIFVTEPLAVLIVR